MLNVLHVVNKGNDFVKSHDDRKVQIVAVTLVDGFAFNVFPQLILMNIKIKLWRHIKFKTKC